MRKQDRMGADGLLLRLVLHKRAEHKVDLLLFRALLVGLLHLVTGSSGGRLSGLHAHHHHPHLGKPTRKKSAVFFNIVQKAFDPPPFV